MQLFKQMMTASQDQVGKGGLTRRGFLAATGGAGIGLVIGYGTRPGMAEAADGSAFNPFVMISPKGEVTVICKHQDKGQGTMTGLAVLVADELDADWAMMRSEFAPSNPQLYNNLSWGPMQGTGGSSGIPNSYMQYRQAGAAARAMLVQAAAKEWGVPAEEITVADGVLSHSSGKSAGFGELAAAAASETPPAEPTLKSPENFKFIGKTGYHRLDGSAKTRGQAVYTQDIEVPDMLYAVLARPPKFGGKVASFDDAEARAVKGVQDVVQTPGGVAVLADNTWAAIKGREALSIDWDDSAAETRSTDQILKEYHTLLDKPGDVAVNEGNAEEAIKGAAKTVEAVFEFPYLCHTPMEPMNAVVKVTPNTSVEIWTGSQAQSFDQMNAAAVAGIEPKDVVIHTVFAGGSFGRRANGASDYVVEATQIGLAIEGRAPVKLIWTREDDVTGGRYRPAYVHRVRAGLDADGKIVGWHHRIVGQSIMTGTAMESMMVKDGVDGTTVEGAAELPYAVGAHYLDTVTTTSPVTVLWWRSVGSTHTAYAVETMMDRLAAAAGVDPLEFRLRNMDAAPREKAALQLAADKAGWNGSNPSENLYRGLAVHKSFGSYVAQVADLRKTEDGSFKVEKVVCAIDCGIAVVPDQVVAQMEGCIGYGLGAVMRNKITLTDGIVDQSNFPDYEPTRMSDMPDVEVHIIPSTEAPSGVGEPGVPPIGPAVANALLVATGQEVNTLPMTDNGIEFA